MPKLSKAERERQEQAANEARIRAALRWTEPAPGPDVLPPSYSDSSGQMSTGYTFSAYTRRVDVACSSSIGHAIGRTDKTDSQRPLSLYSTRLLALKALRNVVEDTCARLLAEIDRQIEGESNTVGK